MHETLWMLKPHLSLHFKNYERSPKSVTSKVREPFSLLCVYMQAIQILRICFRIFDFFQVNGQWKGHSAGGCGNFRDTYKNNPIYQFQLDKNGPLLIELRGPRFVENNCASIQWRHWMPKIKLCQYPLGEGGKLMENPEDKVWELTQI